MYNTGVGYIWVTGELGKMAHTIRDKTKLLNRIRRIRGQIDAVAKALEREEDCSAILMTIAACRGAINGLMAEIIEGHIRFHVVDPDRQPTTEKAKAAQELIEVIKAYLK
jgi:FrmR/RcnR family transcriptional regulator, repressor of frmRAB operon